ncbi:MAG: hypothetical protein Q9202_002597 [Teloschistes flavicans]
MSGFHLLNICLPDHDWEHVVARDTIHPAPLPREERQKLFRRCMESVSDPEQYICMWFKGAPLHEIGRENVKQFFCWSFLNKSNYGLLDDAELEDYANQLESRLGRELPPGKGPANKQADGDTGVIAIEIMPVSFRITRAARTKDEIKDEILRIVRSHGWTKYILCAHSYGSVISTHLLQDRASSSMIEATLLVDPVSILLHLPEVAYNFTCRQPVEANEHQLYYFASTDIGVAHTLSRRFFWQENIIWKHDLEGRRVTVVLCGRDLITNTEAVGRYLASDGSSSWKKQDWKGSGVEIIWFNELDHSQVFERKRNYDRLIKVIQQYTLISNMDTGFEQNGR